MAFLDDLSQSMVLRNQAEAKRQKAMTEISNLNSAIAHEEHMIADTFRQLGVEYFNKNKDNSDAPFYGLIAAILSARQRMDEYRDQIEQVKAIVKCEACGTDIPTGFGYTICTNCGTPLKTAETAPEVNYIRCFSCGRPLSQDTKFCTGCGKPMTEIIQFYANAVGAAQAAANAASAPAQEPNAPADVPPATPAPEPVNTEIELPANTSKTTCPACGSFITEAMAFCVGCGAKLK